VYVGKEMKVFVVRILGRYLVATACTSMAVWVGLVGGAGCATEPQVASRVAGRPGLVAEDPKQMVKASVVDPDAPESPVGGLPPLSAVEPLVNGNALTIQKDCVVSVTVKEDSQLNGSYPVNDVGAVVLGYIGPVILLNKTAREAQAKIKEVLEARSFKTATVTVEIQRASYDNILVTGSVQSPGLIKIGAGDTISLNDALLRANGVSVPVGTARIRVVRGGRLSAIAPALSGETYKLVSETGEPSVPVVALRNNDVVYVFTESSAVEKSEKTVSVLVLGEVKRPGFYTFAGSEPPTVMNLVFKMGGLPPYANDKEIKVVRRDRQGREGEFSVNVRRVMSSGDPELDVPLEEGDRVIVPARRFTLF
jgi:protein involved in polysaccharide export with SLBB domain